MAEGFFARVPTELDFPKEEREILSFWREAKIFEKGLQRGETEKRPTFVFYEGPPTANGLPHNGHVLTRVIKDVFPRYKTMRGFHVPRKAGWDTHGLPVEVEVEKELRIHGKAAIDAYGMEPFVRKCIDSVFRYTDEWEKLTERVGFWVDLDKAYVTYHKEYVESVWWALSELFKKGLLYQGHKVVWWWAQGGTALSSGEVGLGYKTVDDPSVYVGFPLDGHDGVSLLVWTTTPWTLPSNMYAAVNLSLEYVQVSGKPGEAKAPKGSFIVAKALVPVLEKKLGELVVEKEWKAADLVGKTYSAPFDVYRGQHTWRVIAADFVTTDAGTGIVHIAPAFGEDDFNAHKKETASDPNATLLNAVLSDGTFVPELGKYAGRWVKDCDKEIQQELKERGLLVFAEQYRHDYPFCWRAESDPLIQYARPAWYIRTTSKIDRAIENNQQITWLPEHIKDGRFGDFLANNVDWALSRERYWGTPLNVWICEANDAHRSAPCSVDEIEKLGGSFAHFAEAKAKDPSLSPHLVVHKPWIDAVTFPCTEPGCQGTMRRVTEVIDCWFDSGCMPFAQWGYPHQGAADFKASFPADFISEAIDQTRGWFYSQLMISTLLFDEECQSRLGLTPARSFPYPFKTCIVLGHVSDKEGKKESKSKGNYTPPEVVLEEVSMDFAVLGEGGEKAGTALIAREDLEGLDLQEGAKVRLFAPGNRDKAIDLVIKAGKKLPRRVIALAEEDRKALSVKPTGTKDVKPVEVPRLPEDERVTVLDPSSSAPGADAFRWFFYAANPPWNPTRHSLSNVRALQKETLIKLRNVYSFFTIYANVDGFDPSAPAPKRAARAELDRWIASEVETAVVQVTKAMDAYDVYGATVQVVNVVDALSNWYVRRSRERFWKSGWDDDKRGAFATLYECLLTLSKLLAPFVPFASEAMYQNLTASRRRAGEALPESVHLAAFPEPDLAGCDPVLQKTMGQVRELVSLGLQVRTQGKLKVRQPLRVAHVIVADRSNQAALEAMRDMIKEELNVLDVSFVPDAEVEAFVTYRVKPNFRTLGQRGLGKEAQELKKTMGALDAAGAGDLVRALFNDGKATYAGVELVREDVELAFDTKDGFFAAGDRVGVVVLDTRLDDELRALGFCRELVSKLSGLRKELGFDFADKAKVALVADAEVRALVVPSQADVEREVQAETFEWIDETSPSSASPSGGDWKELVVEGKPVRARLVRA